MAPEEEVKPKKVSKEEFDVISNRLAVALAKRESLIKSWTASSSRKETSSKTLEERDAEDAVLFRNQPPYLGVGAPIPAHFFVSDASQDNKSLRAKFFPSKGLKASKARDIEEKVASAKRAMRDVDSDEEQGRSALGRAKKLKSKPRIVPAKKEDTVEQEPVAKEDARTAMKTNIVKKLESEREELLQEPSKDETKREILEASIDTSISQPPPMDDTPMTNTIPTEDVERPSQSKTVHAMDPQERKRMKKREKKRRSRAKQKAAEASLEPKE